MMIDSTSGDDGYKDASDDLSLLIDTLSQRDNPTLSQRGIDSMCLPLSSFRVEKVVKVEKVEAKRANNR